MINGDNSLLFGTLYEDLRDGLQRLDNSTGLFVPSIGSLILDHLGALPVKNESAASSLGDALLPCYGSEFSW
ncbi:hypothetical protein [Paenibacillus xerothermodurans]|uniref:hypothetical protein n=1 Tax=Paenibacillus xerothermodurans TaxID=1977292 RepID=UPI001A9E29D5|nr:hypothetical protein [Paenibacillus xerothermodurans]